MPVEKDSAPDAQEPCQHKNLPVVPFDEEAAKGMTASEVKKRWPRLNQICPTCGVSIICYASYAHYISGDW